MLWNTFGRGHRRGAREHVHDLPNLLKGHLCLVTGASRGIGQQIALEFASKKAGLILVSQDHERLESVAAECRKHGAVRCYTYVANLFVQEEVARLADQILEAHGSIDVLINNAGVASANGMTALNGDPFEWEQMTNLNLVTPMHLARKFAPAMAEKGYGVIINMGSLAGIDAVGPMGAYCATKWGIRGWSLSLHNQLKEHGIKVCLLNPAGTLTERTKEVPNAIAQNLLVPKDISEACLLLFRTSPNCVPSEITLRFAKMPYKQT